ncbi:putative flavodoxin-1 [Lentibacillus sp. JNUCC-1]|uniref:flavodoxin n=1 Tax=Lentibacillus sp. JNUCC-1 TaxID=2654513 RepID=UPI0012E8E0E8|nr:flavodoxin [Lentibacillus sp. JNUCC-1]MUV39011.1 putative flavodoxin-1 [Lentibacillus sp. JNUCC-1]
MSNILMIYASTTGNTELMAEAITDYLEACHHTVEIRTFDFDPIDVEDLIEYDAVLIGTHTWDDGTLPYEVEDFDEELNETDIRGPVYGVFGSADSFYDTYGGAVDILWEHIKDLGGHVIPQKLKVDLTPDQEDIERCQAFAAEVCRLLDKAS